MLSITGTEWVSHWVSEWVNGWVSESDGRPWWKTTDSRHVCRVKLAWRNPVCLSAPVSQMCWSETSELNYGGDGAWIPTRSTHWHPSLLSPPGAWAAPSLLIIKREPLKCCHVSSLWSLHLLLLLQRLTLLPSYTCKVIELDFYEAQELVWKSSRSLGGGGSGAFLLQGSCLRLLRISGQDFTILRLFGDTAALPSLIYLLTSSSKVLLHVKFWSVSMLTQGLAPRWCHLDYIHWQKHCTQ